MSNPNEVPKWEKSETLTEMLMPERSEQAIYKLMENEYRKGYTQGYKDALEKVRSLANEDGPYQLIYEKEMVNDIITNLLNDK